MCKVARLFTTQQTFWKTPELREQSDAYLTRLLREVLDGKGADEFMSEMNNILISDRDEWLSADLLFASFCSERFADLREHEDFRDVLKEEPESEPPATIFDLHCQFSFYHSLQLSPERSTCSLTNKSDGSIL